MHIRKLSLKIELLGPDIVPHTLLHFSLNIRTFPLLIAKLSMFTAATENALLLTWERFIRYANASLKTKYFGKSLFRPEYHILKKALEEKLPKEVIIR